MDPLVREVFEEYLAENPSMAAHAEQLRQARALLSTLVCRAPLSCGVQARVRRRIAHEILHSQPALPLTPTLTFRTIAGLASATVLLMLAGMFAGSLLSGKIDDPAVALQEEVPAEQAVHRPAAMTPLADDLLRSARFDRSPVLRHTALHPVPEVLPVAAALASSHQFHRAP